MKRFYTTTASGEEVEVDPAGGELGDDQVSGKHPAKVLVNPCVCIDIDPGHDIPRSLEAEAMGQPVRIVDERSGLARRLDGDLEIARPFGR